MARTPCRSKAVNNIPESDPLASSASAEIRPGAIPDQPAGTAKQSPDKILQPPASSDAAMTPRQDTAASPSAESSGKAGSDKASTGESLVSLPPYQSFIARDGTPVRLELVPGNPAKSMLVRAWTSDHDKTPQGQYDWRLKVSLPAGGLVERRDPAFWEAPENGYVRDWDFAVSRSLPPAEWKNTLGQSFYVKFDDGTYALVNLQMVAGGAHFVSVKSYLNPAPGSRNLQPPPPPPTLRR